MTYEQFVGEITQAIIKCSVVNESKKIAGFACSSVTGGAISIANTAEALMALEIISEGREIYKSYKDKFNITYIKNLFQKRVEDISKEKEIRISDLAYCGIGLSIIKGSSKKIKQVAELLLKYQIRNKGWSNYSNKNEIDIFSTFISLKFFFEYQSGIKPPMCPIWLTKEEFKSDPNGISIIENGINNQNSIEALTLALYIQKKYYQIEIEEKYLKYVNSYFKSRMKDIIKSNFSKWFEHPISSYKIYSFGIAAYLCENIRDSFVLCEKANYSSINKDFIMNDGREIPKALEYLRLIECAKHCLDPFDINYSNNRVETIINTSITSMTFSIAFFAGILLLIRTLAKLLIDDFAGLTIIECIIAFIIILILDYVELFTKLSTLYFFVIDKIKLHFKKRGNKDETHNKR